MKKDNDKIVEEVLKDFKDRAEKRKSFDLIWQINMNFLMGNQYCNIGYGGQLEEAERQFFWQEREVYNHIAPTFDIRYAKLSKIKPDINVLPSTSDERDKQSAKVSKKIYKYIKNKLKIDSLVNQAIKWSEVCGTVFYKISWNNDIGQIVGIDDKGSKIKSGDIEISVVSPFEIYPDSCVCDSLKACQSLIHAKAYTTAQVKQMYGVEVEGKKVNTYALDSVAEGIGGLGLTGTMPKIIESVKDDSVIVVERYIRPNADYLNGRLTIVAGDKLVFDGELPYQCGEDGERDFPFIRQTSIEEPGCFWGSSVVERLIPVQRAYNAVKNRKHEFLNRLSLGVLSVEDGSVDLDNLEEEGLCPGKVLVYRQGANEPKYLEGENIPSGLNEEEQFLLDEFNKISGVNDLLSFSSLSSNLSGTALELMISQDEARLNAPIESIKCAVKDIASMILRLYKQYASFPRIAKIAGENGEVEMFYFSSSDISSEDIELENITDGMQSLSQRRDLIFSLLENGILQNDDGNLSNRMKSKILEMLGMGIWENAQDITDLHIKKADKENLKLLKNEKVSVSEIDEHKLHINEHIAFMLGQDYEKAYSDNKSLEEKFLTHIREHKSQLEEK